VFETLNVFYECFLANLSLWRFAVVCGSLEQVSECVSVSLCGVRVSVCAFEG